MSDGVPADAPADTRVMPEVPRKDASTPPVVTVVGAVGSGRPADVLVGGGAGGSRVPTRGKGARLVLVLVGSVGVVARAVAADRAEQRATDAALAVSDQVHLQGTVGPVDGSGGVLAATVSVSVIDGQREGNRVTGLRFEGEGVTPRPTDLSALRVLPATLHPEAGVDCAEVAAGRYPAAASAVLDVVPRSGVTHPQRMPVQAMAMRDISRRACELPDPDARVGVEAQGSARGDLLLYVEPVGYSKQTLVIESVTVPGFEVRRPRGQTLPTSLAPNEGGVYDFTVRVTDCAVARSAAETTVILRLDGVPETRVAGDAVSQPQPGGVPAAELFQRLVNLAC